MPSDQSANDAILQPFLTAQDLAESQRQLTILLSEHAEARMRSIIIVRLRSYLSSQEHRADFEDLYSEANLDVEIAVDMLSLVDKYDTAVLVSGDEDFQYAINAICGGRIIG